MSCQVLIIGETCVYSCKLLPHNLISRILTSGAAATWTLARATSIATTLLDFPAFILVPVSFQPTCLRRAPHYLLFNASHEHAKYTQLYSLERINTIRGFLTGMRDIICCICHLWPCALVFLSLSTGALAFGPSKYIIIDGVADDIRRDDDITLNG